MGKMYTSYSPYKEKTVMVQKIRHLPKKKEETETTKKRTQTVIGDNETRQNKRNTKERQHDIRLEDTSSRHLWLINYGERTSTGPLALGYPLLGCSRHVRAYYTTACHSPALAFSAAIYFTTKGSVPCPMSCAIPPCPGLQSSTGRR